jgi:eukaryotic-like serine/threonine-protein kinase
MTDDNTSERNVNIESTVNVGTANDSTVSGTQVSVGSARDVHVHGDTTPPSSLRSVALVGVLAFLSAVLINIATSQLPPGLQPYLWLSWPLAILVTVISIWVAYRQSRSQGSNLVLGSLEQRNRRAMLQKVKAIWIEGLLEQSLAKELRIALDLTEQPNVVDLPLNALVQELQHPPRALPTGISIIDVFTQMGSALLILGAPGAGKTTLLLELARDLITRAEQDEEHPIPVVFNLSSWTTNRQPLKDWLVEELNTKYDVPRKLAQAWMDADMVLPLLDGLDEVALEQRNDCAEIINIYRQEHGLVPLAVCSRMADYEALTTRLRLQAAIFVQPLTKQQVDDYLERAGDKLVGVRAAFHDDTELGEILDTPLMLSIVTLAYAKKSAAEVQAIGAVGERDSHLFNTYIVAMVERRQMTSNYKPEQTIHQLSWLAQQMVRHNQTIYYIERLQQDWLPPRQQREYRIRGDLLTGLITGLVGVLSGWMLFGIVEGLILGLVFGLAVGLAKDDEYIQVTESINWKFSHNIQAVVLSGVLSIGLLGGLLGALLGVLGGGVTIGVAIGVAFGVAFGVVGGLVGGPISKLVGGVIGIPEGGGLVSGLISGVILGVLGWIIGGLNRGLVDRLIGGLVYGMANGLFLGLYYGMTDMLSSVELETKIKPNQGIHRSAQIWLGGGLVIGLAFAVVFALVDGLVTGIGIGLSIGVVFGLGGGKAASGLSVLQHYTLRWLLYRNGSLPFRDLIPFLDHCAERIFLRKVGGGYIFVHRLLLEHFASLYTERKPAAPPSDS